MHGGYVLSGEDCKWLRTSGGFFTRGWFQKNEEKKVLVYWQTENVQTKVMELLIGFEALEEFYSPTGKLLEFCELVAIAEQVLGIQIKNYRQLKSRVLKRYKEETVLDQMERLIEKLREQEYK